MTWLTEKPHYMIGAGVVLVGLALYFWYHTRKRWLLVTAGAVVGLTILGMLLESSIQTEEEKVEATLHQVAADVESNDLDRLLRHVYSQADDVRALASREFPQYKFHSVSIKSNLEVDIDDDHQPPKAVARFNVVVVVSDPRANIKNQRVPVYAEVTFLKEQDKWKVSKYYYEYPRIGLKRTK